MPVPLSLKLDAGLMPPRERTARLVRSVVESGYPNVVLDRLARQTCEIIGVEQACILARDDVEPERAIAVAGHGVGYDFVGTRFTGGVELEPRRPGGSGVGPSRCGAVPTAIANGRRQSIGAGVSAPIMGPGGSVEGALTAGTTQPGRRFTSKDLEILSELADIVGAALSHAQRRAELLSTLRDRIGAVAAAIDSHDGYTAGHSEDVLRLSHRDRKSVV